MSKIFLKSLNTLIYLIKKLIRIRWLKYLKKLNSLFLITNLINLIFSNLQLLAIHIRCIDWELKN